MVATNYWYVTIAPADRLAAVSEKIRSHAPAVADDPAVRETFVEWGQTPAVAHGFDDQGTTPPLTGQLLDAFRRAELTEEDLMSHSVVDTEEFTWDLAGIDRPHPVAGVFAAIKGVPVTSLLYVGLGPHRASRLPGVMGVFAVPPAHVEVIGDDIRKAHAMSPFDRAAALERMLDWLGLGHDPGYPVHHLLEALPEVFGTAASSGRGVFGVTARSA